MLADVVLIWCRIDCWPTVEPMKTTVEDGHEPVVVHALG
jgi:hypothetical protein